MFRRFKTKNKNDTTKLSYSTKHKPFLPLSLIPPTPLLGPFSYRTFSSESDFFLVNNSLLAGGVFGNIVSIIAKRKSL